MTETEKAEKILRDLAGNAAQIKQKVMGDNLKESAKLTGERVALVEALRELLGAKVSLASSDNQEEMSLLVINMRKNVSAAISSINAKLSALSSELSKTRGAKRIAAYKVQGGHYGY